MSASPMSNTDAMCCKIEIPEITHVSDLIDLESNGEINFEEGLKEKKSLRKKGKCSAILKTVTSENMSASPMSNTDAMCCKIEMPEITHVSDLIDLESNGEINFEEGLKEKKSLRKKRKCSAILKTVTSENMSASPMSNTDALCCNVEMPEITHVSDLIDLESNGEINVEEGLKEKKSLRKKRKCSAILKTVTSENMCASPMSNTDALFCNVEMPELTNVFDLVDLESNREINVEEVLGND